LLPASETALEWCSGEPGSYHRIEIGDGRILEEVTMARELSSEKAIRIIAPTEGETIGRDDLALICLTGFEIGRLESSDGKMPKTRNRPEPRWKPVEGFLNFRLNGQETPLRWSAAVSGASSTSLSHQVEDSERFSNRLLYFGKPEGIVDLEVSLIESDEDLRRHLKKAEQITEFAADIAKGIAGPGMAVAGGLTLFGAILEFARSVTKDDLELQLFGALGDPTVGPRKSTGGVPLRTGVYRIERGEAGSPEPDLTISFRVHRVAPAERRRRAIVRIESIELDLEDSLKKHTFVFEAVVGSGRRGKRFGFSEVLENSARGGLENVLAVQDKPIYAGPIDPGAPFRFQIATLRDRDYARALVNVLDAAGGFAGSVIDDPEDTKLAGQVTKAVESLGSLLIDMLPKKSYSLRKEGIIGGGEVTDATEEMKEQLILPDADFSTWQPATVTLAGKRGNVNVTLGIGPLPPAKR
jgi:hypothetical protein